jgi:DNA (cytosine-5)-methyltransferase 1
VKFTVVDTTAAGLDAADGAVTQSDAAVQFVDLFAGIGGLRQGLALAGMECVFACEIDRKARQTYEANFGPCEGRDIRSVDARSIPLHHVLAAGFPCQPFSLAGVSKKASLGKAHGFDEERSGNLFFEITRILRVHRSPVVLLENVKNLLSHDRGRTLDRIKLELESLNYEVVVGLLDARYWLPQHRERVFIVGLQRAALPKARFVFPDPPRDQTSPVLRDVLEPSWDAKYVLGTHLWEYLQAYRAKHAQRGNGFGYSLFRGDDVARTLSARYHKDGSEILIDTNSHLPRRLTPTECARLMGFPRPSVDRNALGLAIPRKGPAHSFVIPVSDTAAYRQFGNSVAVPVVEFVARHLLATVPLEGVAPSPGLADEVSAA